MSMLANVESATNPLSSASLTGAFNFGLVYGTDAFPEIL
jgi:hypothetical protein